MNRTQLPERILRVMQAINGYSIDVNLRIFDEPAKTAQAAADLLHIEIGQIANSLIFEDALSAQLILIITSGAHRVDIDYVNQTCGVKLTRANPDRIREETGFVIGGIPPVGHSVPLKTYLDRALLNYGTIWAAAGIAEAVFSIRPHLLETITSGTWIDVSCETDD